MDKTIKDPVKTPGSGPVPHVWTNKKDLLKRYRTLIGFFVLVLVLAILTDGTFLMARNLTNLTRQVAINGILAIGMTYVILLGGIDLSVGSIVALAGIAAGLLQANLGLAEWTGVLGGMGALLSIGVAVLVGGACGVFNGWWITRFKIAPFIITLGMMVIARGLALIFSGGAAIAPLGASYNFLGQGYIPSIPAAMGVSLVSVGIFARLWKRSAGEARWAGVVATLLFSGVSIWVILNYRGLPIPVLIFALIGAVGMLVLQRTRAGRFVLAIGGNPEAAWLAGVPIRKISFWVYVVIGLLAGLSGAILSSRLNGALPTAGQLFELDAIAAVVIGGSSLKGGVGTIRGSIMGAFFIGALNNGMSLLAIPEFYQMVIKGVIIILAVWLDTKEDRS